MNVFLAEGNVPEWANFGITLSQENFHRAFSEFMRQVRPIRVEIENFQLEMAYARLRHSAFRALVNMGVRDDDRCKIWQQPAPDDFRELSRYMQLHSKVVQQHVTFQKL